MNVTREIVKDLLPLYVAGEGSARHARAGRVVSSRATRSWPPSPTRSRADELAAHPLGRPRRPARAAPSSHGPRRSCAGAPGSLAFALFFTRAAALVRRRRRRVPVPAPPRRSRASRRRPCAVAAALWIAYAAHRTAPSCERALVEWRPMSRRLRMLVAGIARRDAALAAEPTRRAGPVDRGPRWGGSPSGHPLRGSRSRRPPPERWASASSFGFDRTLGSRPFSTTRA